MTSPLALPRSPTLSLHPESRGNRGIRVKTRFPKEFCHVFWPRLAKTRNKTGVNAGAKWLMGSNSRVRLFLQVLFEC